MPELRKILSVFADGALGTLDAGAFGNSTLAVVANKHPDSSNRFLVLPASIFFPRISSSKANKSSFEK